MQQTVLITGATSGIGKACAIIFAQNNYNVIITGRRNNLLQALQTQIIQQYKVSVLTLNFDVQDKNAVCQNLENLPQKFKNIDVLINNAGLSLDLTPIQNASISHWDTMIDTNIKGFLYVTKIVANNMIANKKGHIVNIGSIAGKEVYANGNVYCATKHAVNALSQAMRIDLLTHQIKVSAIHPGAVNTEFSLVRFAGDVKKANKVYQGYDALTPSDIAQTIWFVVNTPAHVNINDLVIMPTAQATATYWHKNL